MAQPAFPYMPTASRRKILIWSASALALGMGGTRIFAQSPILTPAATKFLDLSRLLTGYDDLDAATALRIHDALLAVDPTHDEKFARLAEMSKTSADANALRDAANAAGLGDPLTAIVSAWFTGTVTGGDRPQVITYRDALMYRPVADGLVVPTYCNKGPMWWQDALPPGVTRVPLNNPKVL